MLFQAVDCVTPLGCFGGADGIRISEEPKFVEGVRDRHGVRPVDGDEVFALFRIVDVFRVILRLGQHVEGRNRRSVRDGQLELRQRDRRVANSSDPDEALTRNTPPERLPPGDVGTGEGVVVPQEVRVLDAVQQHVRDGEHVRELFFLDRP